MTLEEFKNINITIKVNTIKKIGEALDDDTIEELYAQMVSDNKENEEFIEEALSDEYVFAILDDVIADNIEVKCKIS